MAYLLATKEVLRDTNAKEGYVNLPFTTRTPCRAYSGGLQS